MGANPEGSGPRGVCPTWHSCGRERRRQFHRSIERSLGVPVGCCSDCVSHTIRGASGKCELERGTRGLRCFLGCAAQASATCINGNSIRAPMGNSGDFKPSAVESSIQRSSRQQVPVRGQEVCIFQSGRSSNSHCQLGRRRSGEVIFAAGSETCPTTDCSCTCR